MSYPAHVTDTAYRYDGSFAGFLCCIFESYARHEIPAAIWGPEQGQLTMFGARDIPTDVLIKLANLYKTSTDYLLGLTDDPAPRR